MQKSERIGWVPVERIKPNRWNPNEMNLENFHILVEDMKENGTGTVDPVLLRPLNRGYELVDGENRWRAARKLGWKSMRAVIRKMSDDDAKAVCYRKNRERGTLNAFREARLFQGEAKSGLSYRVLGQKYGVSDNYVSDTLKLLRIGREVIELVGASPNATAITRSHWEIIADLEDLRRQKSVAKAILEKGLSTRDVYKLIKTEKQPQSTRQTPSLCEFETFIASFLERVKSLQDVCSESNNTCSRCKVYSHSKSLREHMEKVSSQLIDMR